MYTVLIDGERVFKGTLEECENWIKRKGYNTCIDVGITKL